MTSYENIQSREERKRFLLNVCVYQRNQKSHTRHVYINPYLKTNGNKLRLQAVPTQLISHFIKKR